MGRKRGAASSWANSGMLGPMRACCGPRRRGKKGRLALAANVVLMGYRQRPERKREVFGWAKKGRRLAQGKKEEWI